MSRNYAQTCQSCGDEFRICRLRRTGPGVRDKCFDCASADCDHENYRLTPASERPYCRRCGLIADENGQIDPSKLGVPR